MILEISMILIGVALGIVYSKRYDDVSLDASIEDKIRELPNIFRHARGTIKIATDFDKRFFNHRGVKEAIKKAIEGDVEVMFLTDQIPPSWYVNQEK